MSAATVSPYDLADIDGGRRAFWVHVHVPDYRCHAWHCHVHNVDELDYRGGTGCVECGHAYRSDGDLVARYRAMMRRDWRAPWSRPRVWPDVGMRQPRLAVTVWAWLRRYALVRADTIYFCPECSHDF